MDGLIVCIGATAHHEIWLGLGDVLAMGYHLGEAGSSLNNLVNNTMININET